MPDFQDPRLARPVGAASARQVAASAAPILEAPGPEARTATLALHGETVDLFTQEGSYGLVQCRRDRFVGWTPLAALAAPVMTSTHKVSVLRAIAFAAPDFKSPVNLMLSLGARLAATGRREGPWLECARAGWVHAVHLAGLAEVEDDPAAVAERYLGAPYLWGGRESLGLDCSGLTQQAFEACGVIFPRDSDMQVAWIGAELTGNDPDWPKVTGLQRGDLVFWEGHVGILTGPGRLLHANAHHMAVAEEPLAEVVERIGKSAGPVTSVRRVDLAAARAASPAWLQA